jgi:phage shock protein A
MTQKQTILGRISQLAKANINGILDRAEDPEKMLDQLVRDYTNSIAEAEEAVAQTIANVRMAEADLKSDEETAQEWGRKAGAASRKAEELRAGGDASGADKFDNLAKVALSRQIQHEGEANAARPAIEQQNVTVEKLKEGLVSMKTKLGELKSKRGTLVARARSVEAQGKVNEAMRSIDVMDPTSDLGRFEDKIKREEALVAGRAEAQSTSLEDQFDQLEDHGNDAEIEARLAALKNQG